MLPKENEVFSTTRAQVKFQKIQAKQKLLAKEKWKKVHKKRHKER